MVAVLGRTNLAVAFLSGMLSFATVSSAQCVGDCDGDGRVSVDEVIAGVGVLLGASPASVCPSLDANDDQRVAIDEIVTGVLGAIEGCPLSASRVVVLVTQSEQQRFDEWAVGLGDRVEVSAVEDPEAALRDGPAEAIRLAVVPRLDCTECYAIDRIDGGWRVLGGAPLGIQYGATHFLEKIGFRFFHPRAIHVPDRFRVPRPFGVLGRGFAPETARRGLHLNTLHPTEAFFDFWVPGESSLEGARRTIDWLVKNRGNELEWVALDEHQADTTGFAAWREHTRRIVDYAHLRGVRVGIGARLLGRGNEERAFDLLDSEQDIADARNVIRARLSPLLSEPAFDRLHLDLGDLSGADPAEVVSLIDLTRDVLGEIAPNVEVSATVGVGDSDDRRIEYRGEELLFPFVVKFADARITPLVRTVMYYELFGEAGGAFGHDTFAEHAAFLVERLQAGAPVGFFPESAHWMTFDDSVPFYAPLYIRSRWYDLNDIRQRAAAGGFAPPDELVVSSSGWEWGYWQNGYAALRMAFTLPEKWEDTVTEMFAPWGETGETLATAVTILGQFERESLIHRRLAPYLAGRDATLDANDALGIRTQPSRPSPAEIAGLAATDVGSFRLTVLSSLEELALATNEIVVELRRLDLPLADPWVAEVVDAIEVTARRVRFVEAIYAAAIDVAVGSSPAQWMGIATASLEAARSVVARRHGRLHDPDPRRLLDPAPNATSYPYGYLRYADELCYWERELAQLREALGQEVSVPDCSERDPS